nr:immunoglobulin heavy chain junction region [Mus musculus]
SVQEGLFITTVVATGTSMS